VDPEIKRQFFVWHKVFYLLRGIENYNVEKKMDKVLML